MAPMAVRMVLMEGERAGGVTLDQDDFHVGPAPAAAANQVIEAILGTRGSGAEGGDRLQYQGGTRGTAPPRPLRCGTRWQDTRSTTSCSCRHSWPQQRWPKLWAVRLAAPAPPCFLSSRPPRRWQSSTRRTGQSSTCSGAVCPTAATP